jgi:AraC-like DNA-binding protein/uncharacterized membrane protein YidH (DUF202 family)
MLSNFILFTTAVLGFLCTALIFGKNKYQEHSLINKYLIFITATNSIRFLVYGIAQVYPETNISKVATMLDVSIIMMMPCFYLYFTNIIYESKFVLTNLLHFMVPFLLGSLFVTAVCVNPNLSSWIRKAFFITVFLFYIIYAIAGFMLLYKHMWQRNTVIKAIQKQNDLMKNWSIFLYVTFILLVLIRAITGVIINKTIIFSNQYLWVPALVWTGVFVKIILTPEILYGYNLLNKSIDAAAEKLALRSVWNFEGTALAITREKDIKLAEKIKPMLKEYLHQMEEFSFHTNAFRNPDLSPEDIATGLKIPVSHVNYILKFHCNESFTDYKKIVRIHDATKLLEQEYLKEHKVESLASKVGFSSYNTFIIAFKSITGVTVQEFVKRI